MATQTLPRIETQPRERLGSRYAARIRQAGRLPAVVYGHNQDPLHLSVDARHFVEVLHGNAHLIEVVVGDNTEPALIKDVQWDHLGRQIIHVDLARVDLTEEVEVEVEVVLTGEPPALNEAGTVLDHPETVLEVRCLANNIPQRITVDVSELKVDEAITIGDLKLPEGVTAAGDPDTVIARISIVEELPEEEEVAEDAAAEPEVIGRAKEDESDEENK